MAKAHQGRPPSESSRLLTIKLPPRDSDEGRVLARAGFGAVRWDGRETGKGLELVPFRYATLLWMIPASSEPRVFIRYHQELKRAVKAGKPVPVLYQYFDGRPAEVVFEPWRLPTKKKTPPASMKKPGRPRKLTVDALRASIRKRSGLTDAARARLLGVSKSTVNRLRVSQGL